MLSFEDLWSSITWLFSTGLLLGFDLEVCWGIFGVFSLFFLCKCILRCCPCRIANYPLSFAGEDAWVAVL